MISEGTKLAACGAFLYGALFLAGVIAGGLAYSRTAFLCGLLGAGAAYVAQVLEAYRATGNEEFTKPMVAAWLVSAVAGIGGAIILAMGA